MNTILTKKVLHEVLEGRLKEKLVLISEQIAYLKESISQDTKSSAGDKYETGREMMRQEIDKAEHLQQDYQQQLEILNSLNPESRHEQVQKGSMVLTSNVVFYLAVGFGKMEMGDQPIFVMSLQAPLARQMMGKGVGDRVAFNGVDYLINAVY